jgi:hypothetical protein
MFGMSFGKVAVLVAIIAIVWFGFRWFQRWEKERREAADGRGAGRLNRGRDAPPAGAKAMEPEVMTACRICGAYVAPGARACGKPNCPFPRG